MLDTYRNIRVSEHVCIVSMQRNAALSGLPDPPFNFKHSFKQGLVTRVLESSVDPEKLYILSSSWVLEEFHLDSP